MSELIFRRANENDAETVRTLTHAAYAKWVPVIGRRPKPMNVDYEQAVQTHAIELAYEDGVLVALYQIIPAADHLLLENIAVAPAHQRQGLGHRLMVRIEALARARGLAKVRLYTNKAFDSNLEFYQKLGYAIEREEPIKAGGTLVHLGEDGEEGLRALRRATARPRHWPDRGHTKRSTRLRARRGLAVRTPGYAGRSRVALQRRSQTPTASARTRRLPLPPFDRLSLATADLSKRTGRCLRRPDQHRRFPHLGT